MKKTYNEPTTKVVRMRVATIMSGSVDITVNDTPYEGEDNGIGAKEDFDW